MLARSLLAVLALLFAASLFPSVATATTHDTDEPNPTSQLETPLFAKVYALPLPLPTKQANRIHASQTASLSPASLREDTAFRKSYALAATFDVASLESRKPIQSTDKFQKLAHIPDPFEKLNRSFFRSAVLFEKILIRPVAKGWRKIPRPLTAPLVNFSRNLSRTTSFLNALLQGNAKRASEVFFSFVLDSTLGFGGLINLSKHVGIPQAEEDFGQTLARYGVGSGPYLVSLLTGPSTVRDTSGRVVDIVGNIYGSRYLSPYWNPLYYLLFVETGASAGVGTGVSLGLYILKEIDSYAKAVDQIEALEQGSLDFYAATKRFYGYHRALQILNAEQPPARDEAPAATEPQDDPFADIEEETEQP